MDDTFSNPKRHHKAIKTRQVYNEGNQVLVKADNLGSQTSEALDPIWYPISFQWIPVVQLQENLVQQSNNIPQ